MSCASRPPLAALLAALAAAGCTPDPGPRPVSVEPAWGDSTASTPIVVRGDRFTPAATQDLGGAAGDSTDAGFSAWLGDTPLVDVRWVDVHTLTAVVPAGLSKGSKDLVVKDAGGRKGHLAGAFLVGVPSVVLAQEGSLERSVVSVGQAVVLTVGLRNDGNQPATAVLPEVTVSGAGALTLASAPAARDLAPGASATFEFGYTAAAAGPITLTVSTRVEGPLGGEVSASPALALAFLVQLPPVLEAVLSIPVAFAPGAFEATLTVHNRGEATAAGVTAAALTVVAGSTATASQLVGFAGARDIPGGEARSFVCTWLAGAGKLMVEGSAAGTDANTGFPVATGPVSSMTATVGAAPEVVLLQADALGDGSPFAFVNAWQGRLLVGPNASAGMFAELDPDAGGKGTVGLALPKDVNAEGEKSRNGLSSAPPFPSLGSAACSAAARAACGPDLEDARGLVKVETWGGTPWLLAGGARTGRDLRYLYATPDPSSPLTLRYADLSRVLAGGVAAFTAARAVDGRLYLGFGGPDAALVALDTQPAAGGLDANSGGDATDLEFKRLPRLGRDGSPSNPASVVTIDVVEWFGGQLFLANNGGFARSTLYPPRAYQSHPEDWANATPSAAAWSARTSVTVSSAANLTPRDRAVPAAVAWNGRFFAIRNTTLGPQLWACSPLVGGDPAACDPGDWLLYSPNTSGDALLTQANDTGNLRAGLLVATGAWLYLGLENDAGVQLYRTATATPVNVSDFRGKGGCIAGGAGCEGFGGDGFGTPALATRFLDAKALFTGADAGLYFTAGNGADPARLYFVPD